jgi:hypothetical protein
VNEERRIVKEERRIVKEERRIVNEEWRKKKEEWSMKNEERRKKERSDEIWSNYCWANSQTIMSMKILMTLNFQNIEMP